MAEKSKGEKLFGKSPKMETEKPAGKDAPMGGEADRVEAGTDGIPVHEVHTREMKEMHGRHEKERRDMHTRHEGEHGAMRKKHEKEMGSAGGHKPVEAGDKHMAEKPEGKGGTEPSKK